MKYNHNFGKFKSETEIEFGPIPLVVVTHHHEEWDEPVYDPETGETAIDPETGEQKTNHMSRDWDTFKRQLFPTAAEYRQMEYLPIIDKKPETPAPDGQHYEQQGYQPSLNGQALLVHYVLVPNPSPSPRRWSRRSLKTTLVNAGKWDEVKAMLIAIDKYEDLLMCDYIEETNYDFLEAYNKAVEQFGKEAVDELIDTIETEKR